MEILMSHFALNSSEHLLARMATFRDFLIDSLQPSSLVLTTLKISPNKISFIPESGFLEISFWAWTAIRVGQETVTPHPSSPLWKYLCFVCISHKYLYCKPKFSFKLHPVNSAEDAMSMEPSLHKLPLVARTVREPHDSDSIGQTLIIKTIFCTSSSGNFIFTLLKLPSYVDPLGISRCPIPTLTPLQSRSPWNKVKFFPFC